MNRNMKYIIKNYIQKIKNWSLVDWVINLRYIGYIVIFTNIIVNDNSMSTPNLVMFGGIILLIENQLRKRK